MTKTLKTIILLVAISMSGLSISYAQSKKKLKAEITELKTENAQLQRENDGLDRENESLRKENKSFLDQNGQLRQQVVQLQRDYDALNREHQTLTTDYDALKGSSTTTGGGGASSGGGGTSSGGGGGTLPNPGDDRKCAFYQGNLSVNTSYTEAFAPLNSAGWGVQVNAYRNLCQAAEKAEAFKKKFSRYKTYLRCKESNGVQIYAVVYGSLRERDQAKTYLNNLKKKYRSTFGSSFLVQH